MNEKSFTERLIREQNILVQKRMRYHLKKKKKLCKMDEISLTVNPLGQLRMRDLFGISFIRKKSSYPKSEE